MLVRRFQAEDAAAIARLNARLSAKGARFLVYSEGVEQDRSRPITDRLYVSVDGEEIRGAVWLQEYPVRVGDRDVIMGSPKYLVAESLFDSRYVAVPRRLLIHCSQLQPLLIGLGYGGHGSSMARMLAAMRWEGQTVPFFFRIVSAGRVLRELAPIRSTAARRRVADAVRVTGLPDLVVSLMSGAGALRAPRLGREIRVDEVAQFGPWADDTWDRSARRYGFLTVRNHAMLCTLFPGTMPDITRLRVTRSGSDVGWAVVLLHDFAPEPDRRFGRLHVGMLADVLADPEDARIIVGAATEWLIAHGAEIIITNQSHVAWIAALRRAAFFEGPVNYASYRSPPVEQLLEASDLRGRGMHFTRGEGDGPIWYPLRPTDDAGTVRRR
ncbi:MAG TPA: hypothetical protein VMH39_14735 [Gemmatimonadaceae bacterium]|nr:hypothetical protein [Gemmatimonadaceae bacterium]